MRVAVTGSRHEKDERFIWKKLDAFHQTEGPIHCLIHGACQRGGVDELAAQWAKINKVKIEPYPVDHTLDGEWPAAGPRRNGRMLRQSAPDILLKFPGGRGTNDCARQARVMGIRIKAFAK